VGKRLSKPVAGLRFEETPFELSEEAAAILADAWTSERNRLSPSFESAPDPRDDAWQRSRNPNALLIFIDLFARISDWITRRSLRSSVVEDLGIPPGLRRRLRIAFDAAYDNPEVKVLHDHEMRQELTRVLLAVARGG
jgi:hypothetical protein